MRKLPDCTLKSDQRRRWCSLFLPSVRRCFMPRRGWSTLEVPDGWSSSFGAEKWPLRSPQNRQKPAPPVRQSDVQGAWGLQSLQNLQRARAAARYGNLKSFGVMTDLEVPTVDAFRAELQKVQVAAAVPTLDVQIE